MISSWFLHAFPIAKFFRFPNNLYRLEEAHMSCTKEALSNVKVCFICFVLEIRICIHYHQFSHIEKNIMFFFRLLCFIICKRFFLCYYIWNYFISSDNVWYPYYYSIFINLVLLKSKNNNLYSSIIFFQSVVQKLSQFMFHCEYFCDIQICKQNVHREKESLFVIITF